MNSTDYLYIGIITEQLFYGMTYLMILEKFPILCYKLSIPRANVANYEQLKADIMSKA
jgi:hypothetical protein